MCFKITLCINSIIDLMYPISIQIYHKGNAFLHSNFTAIIMPKKENFKIMSLTFGTSFALLII